MPRALTATGLCARHPDVAWWTSSRRSDRERAAEVCGRCPVLAACREWSAQNGINSSQAQAARQQLVSDILSASGNASQGANDLNNYTAAVQQNGANSQAAGSARAKLIQDLENAGLSAHDAANLVDGLTTSIQKLPDSKTIKITMDGSGLYTSPVRRSPRARGRAAAGTRRGAWLRAATSTWARGPPPMT